jgi:hypothetical protein
MTVPARYYSVYKEGRLIVVVRSGAGTFHRSGTQEGNVLATVRFADVTSFCASDEAQVTTLLGKAKGLDDFLFKLKLEGYELRDGEPKYDLPYGRW